MYTPEFSKPRVLSVSQLNFYIKSIIENDARLNFVFVTGEISNLTDHYRSGHIYLSIKDEKSVIRAVMFAGNARNLKFRPTDGMKVICRGRVAVYEPTGQYQLYIEDMQPDGIGALSLAYEQLKKSLAEKGLFAPEHKKKIPPFPNSIGVITSPTGAAVQDIRNILSRRFPSADIIMCPVLVQGENAPAQLIDAVQKLAYAIYNCKIPVISAVGHETDFAICDFVSDLRAPTPSAAAELAVPDTAELVDYYKSQKQYVSSMATLKLRQEYNALTELKTRLSVVSPQQRIFEYEKSLELCKTKIQHFVQETINKKAADITKTAAKLEGLNPVKILSRGYSIAEKNGKAVNSAKMLKSGDEFTLRFSDGEIKAKATGE